MTPTMIPWSSKSSWNKVNDSTGHAPSNSWMITTSNVNASKLLSMSRYSQLDMKKKTFWGSLRKRRVSILMFNVIGQVSDRTWISSPSRNSRHWLRNSRMSRWTLTHLMRRGKRNKRETLQWLAFSMKTWDKQRWALNLMLERSVRGEWLKDLMVPY